MGKEARRVNFLAIDIDQTLTERQTLVKTHLDVYNQYLELGMTTDGIDKASMKYAKTFDVPEIQAFRQQSKEMEAQFEKVRTEIRTSPEVHLNFRFSDGAQEGVQLLTDSENSQLQGYYTVRPKKIKDVTKQWLENNQFPHSERVVICGSHEDKLRKIMVDVFLRERNRLIKNTRTVIIDDSIKELSEAAILLAEKSPVARSLIKRTIIVGFGVDEENKNKLLEGVIYPQLGLQTLSLPSWERSNVEQLIHDLKN